MYSNIKYCQTDSFPDKGNLIVNIVSITNEAPVNGATVVVMDDNQNNTYGEYTTDDSGQTEVITLGAPEKELSLTINANIPYAKYSLMISANGFESVLINGVEILSDVTAIQNIRLMPRNNNDTVESFVIPDHTLYGDYPPKIAESEIKDVNETSEIVLSKVVIPEYIVVHDGPPGDRSAKDYYVRYKDYIKNVASSEIYATWPLAAIQANVLAIMSFTLNRVYTEWYRNRGYNFTITSSTAFDQKWINGRNYYNTISNVVDTIFVNYLSKPNIKQPLFTQYCDGKNATCPNWMTQWGSKSLADQGLTAIEILRRYYGSNVFINTATEVSGIPSSWPGYNLNNGASGQKVLQLQKQLNTIANTYKRIPKIAADGIYGNQTKNAVKVFQSIFGLSPNGITDFPTWYKISEIYVAVTKIAEFI
ncbi:MAG: peptidoglycan-binding protein [Lachnospiraceae bacterium]|nr:peptidoglycan-binding protein [Lachnospiraceae bacterium]